MGERATERDGMTDAEYADDLEQYAEKRWSDPHEVLSDHMTMVPRYTLREAARRLRQPEPAREGEGEPDDPIYERETDPDRGGERELRDRIKQALHSYRCQYSIYDNEVGMALVDLFSVYYDETGPGLEELDLLADHLAAELAEPAREGEGEPDDPIYERETDPDQLRAMARWFDNPNETPAFAVTLPASMVGGVPTDKRFTPGYLLRRVADGWEAHREEASGG